MTGTAFKVKNVNIIKFILPVLAAAMLWVPGVRADEEVFETGQALFEEKCISCHTIGQGLFIGPDLAEITEKRERDWLKRIIQEPTEFREEGDPVAVELFAEYGVEMTDYELSDEDVEAILV